MLRHAFVVCVLSLAACTPGSKFPPSSPLDLEAKTVALVRLRSDGALHSYCSGVWLSASTIATARHCTSQLDVGDSLEYMTHVDAFLAGSFKPRDQIITRDAVLSAVDEEHDLALLTAVNPPRHPSAGMALNSVYQGARVRTMGMPLGLWWSYSSGEISAVRAIPDGDGGDVLCVQTTAPISPGNSGGALFDENGDVVGIAHGSMVDGQNLNLFIHVSYLDALVRATR